MSKRFDANALKRQMSAPVKGMSAKVGAVSNVAKSAFRDVDLKSTPMGRVGGGSILTVKLRLGHALPSGVDQNDPYIDLFARGLSQRGDTEGGFGVMAPTNLKYWRDQHYFEQNPAKLSQIKAQASSDSVFDSAQIAVVRRTPFGETVGERYSFAAFLDPSNQQTKNVIIPANAEIDGTTFLRIYAQPYGSIGAPADEFLTLMLHFQKLAERRAAVIGE